MTGSILRCPGIGEYSNLGDFPKGYSGASQCTLFHYCTRNMPMEHLKLGIAVFFTSGFAGVILLTLKIMIFPAKPAQAADSIVQTAKEDPFTLSQQAQEAGERAISLRDRANLVRSQADEAEKEASAAETEHTQLKLRAQEELTAWNNRIKASQKILGAETVTAKAPSKNGHNGHTNGTTETPVHSNGLGPEKQTPVAPATRLAPMVEVPKPDEPPTLETPKTIPTPTLEPKVAPTKGAPQIPVTPSGTPLIFDKSKGATKSKKDVSDGQEDP